MNILNKCLIAMKLIWRVLSLNMTWYKVDAWKNIHYYIEQLYAQIRNIIDRENWKNWNQMVCSKVLFYILAENAKTKGNTISVISLMMITFNIGE